MRSHLLMKRINDSRERNRLSVAVLSEGSYMYTTGFVSVAVLSEGSYMYTTGFVSHWGTYVREIVGLSEIVPHLDKLPPPPPGGQG